ncbi:MAG TPA: response regulator [Candidatus Paceibacterota bacterium]|nr:response regulator [Candidatus Paceibacterota bacterium]
MADEEPQKRKILVAEDENPLREALIDRLSVEPEFEVFGAADGEEALQMLEELRPDLVLLDIAMPKKNGLAVYQEMKSSLWGDKIKVMFLTNSSGLTDVAFAQQYGLVDYLVKADWDIEDIVKKIKEKF